MGGWWRADGSRWQLERNEKRKREGKAKMAAWQEEKARRKAVREEAGKENLQYIVRSEDDIIYRLRRQAELDDLIDAVKHNGRSITASICTRSRPAGGQPRLLSGQVQRVRVRGAAAHRRLLPWVRDYCRRSSYNISRQPACSLNPAHPAQTHSHLQPAVCTQICLL